jgi:hypothetical protein
MTRLISSSRHVVTVLSILALMLVGCGGAEGDGTRGTAGSGGTRGTAGSGGTGDTVTAKIDLPECALRGYYILYGQLWGELQYILVYLDRRIDPPDAGASGVNTTSKPIPHRATLPPIEDLADPQKKKPRVAWKSFSWEANPDDPVQGWENRADFYQGLDESIYGVEDDPLTITINEYIAPSFYLDLGFYNTTVAVVDWRIVALGNYIGKGTFSINGLDNDVVRVTIVRFPECAPEPANSQPALCADPPPGDLWYDLDEFPDIPWFDEGDGCRFDLTSFGLHVDVRTIGTAEPFAVVIGFKATIPGHVLENGSITVSPEGVSSFTGTYDGQPASFDYDPDTGEVIITFTGEPETRCTLDSTDSVSLVNCE